MEFLYYNILLNVIFLWYNSYYGTYAAIGSRDLLNASLVDSRNRSGLLILQMIIRENNVSRMYISITAE